MTVLSAAILVEEAEALGRLRKCLGICICPKVREAKALPSTLFGAQQMSAPHRSTLDTLNGDRLALSLMCHQVMDAFGSGGRDRLLEAGLDAVKDLGLNRCEGYIEEIVRCAAETCLVGFVPSKESGHK
jgi:hypothetical protein